MPRIAMTADRRLLQGVNRRSLAMVDAALAEGGDPNRTVAVDEQGHQPTAGPRARFPAAPTIGAAAGSAWLQTADPVRETVPLLIWAVRKATPAIVQRLIDAGADVRACEPLCGRTALLDAAQNGQVKMLRALLAAGANVNDQDHPGNSAFSWNHPKVRTVLAAAGHDLNLPDAQGRRPLHSAAWRGDASQVAWCLRHGADVHVRDVEEATPLHLAAVRSDPRTLLLLLQAGADRTARNAQGQVPRDQAVLGGRSGQAFDEAVAAHERAVLSAPDVGPAVTGGRARRRL